MGDRFETVDLGPVAKLGQFFNKMAGNDESIYNPQPDHSVIDHKENIQYAYNPDKMTAQDVMRYAEHYNLENLNNLDDFKVSGLQQSLLRYDERTDLSPQIVADLRERENEWESIKREDIQSIESRANIRIMTEDGRLGPQYKPTVEELSEINKHFKDDPQKLELSPDGWGWAMFDYHGQKMATPVEFFTFKDGMKLNRPNDQDNIGEVQAVGHEHKYFLVRLGDNAAQIAREDLKKNGIDFDSLPIDGSVRHTTAPSKDITDTGHSAEGGSERLTRLSSEIPFTEQLRDTLRNTLGL
jgi:hypothetical protein